LITESTIRMSRPGAIREHRGIGYYTKKVLKAGPFAEDVQRYFE